MNEGLKEFNAQTRNPMALVLFTYAASHVLRIGRIIRQPFGNALLVGFGGVGRQSLTKLATFMAGFNLFQVQISKLYGAVEWEDDLKVIHSPRLSYLGLKCPLCARNIAKLLHTNCMGQLDILMLYTT